MLIQTIAIILGLSAASVSYGEIFSDLKKSIKPQQQESKKKFISPDYAFFPSLYMVPVHYEADAKPATSELLLYPTEKAVAQKKTIYSSDPPLKTFKKSAVFFKTFKPVSNEIEMVGVTWGKCAQKKKGFYVYYQSPKKIPHKLELRGFVSLKTEGELDVSGLMLTGKLDRPWLLPNLFMDFSMTSKSITTFEKPRIETSLNIKY